MIMLIMAWLILVMCTLCILGAGAEFETEIMEELEREERLKEFRIK